MNTVEKELIKLLESKKESYDSAESKSAIDNCINDIKEFFTKYLAVTISSGDELSVILSDEIFSNLNQFLGKDKSTSHITLDPIVGNDIKLNIGKDNGNSIPDIDQKKVMLYLFSKENNMKISPTENKVFDAPNDNIDEELKSNKSPFIVKNYPRVSDLPNTGNSDVIYSIANTGVLYAWNNTKHKYILIKQSKPYLTPPKKHNDIYISEKLSSSDKSYNKQEKKYTRKKVISNYFRKKK